MAKYDSTGFAPRIFERFSARYGGNAVGATLIIVSSLTMATMMAAVKELSADYAVFQIILARAVGQVVVLIPFMIRSRGDLLRSQRIDLQILRAVLAFTGLTCWFYTIAHMQLAEASAINFSRTIFIVAFAAILFTERVGIVGWAATLIGLTGVMVMLDPTATEFNDAALVGALGAAATAAVAMTIKKLTQTDSTATIMTFGALGLTVFCAIPAIFVWQPITVEAAPLFVASVLCGVFSQWCFISAYRYGEASVLATVEYSRLIAAAAIGYFIFAELPTLVALAGMALIVAATFIAMRRHKIAARLGL